MSFGLSLIDVYIVALGCWWRLVNSISRDGFELIHLPQNWFISDSIVGIWCRLATWIDLNELMVDSVGVSWTNCNVIGIFFLLCCRLNGLGLRLTDLRPVTQPKLDLGLRRGWSGGAGAEGRAALNKWMKHSGCQRSRERWVWLDVWCVRLPVRTKWRKCQLHWIDGREAVHPHLHRCNIKKSPRVSQEETLHSSSVWRAEEVQSSWSAEEKGKVLPPLINNRRNIFFFSVVSAAARRVEARGHFHSQPILLYLENVPVKSEENKKTKKNKKNKKQKKQKKEKRRRDLFVTFTFYLALLVWKFLCVCQLFLKYETDFAVNVVACCAGGKLFGKKISSVSIWETKSDWLWLQSWIHLAADATTQVK